MKVVVRSPRISLAWLVIASDIFCLLWDLDLGGLRFAQSSLNQTREKPGTRCRSFLGAAPLLMARDKPG